MMDTAIRNLVAAALLFAAPAAAQDVSGTWDVTWAQAVRNNADGSMDVQKWGEATLVLVQKGERVTGTWTTRVPGVVKWAAEGTFKDGWITLTATSHDSKDPEIAAITRIRWRGAFKGDRLEGEMSLDFRGSDRERPWRPWRAKLRPASPLRGLDGVADLILLRGNPLADSRHLSDL